jgi:hypothetical protein
MKAFIINDSILHVQYPNLKEVNLAFFRITEWYESPSEKLNMKFVKDFDYMDLLEENTDEDGSMLFFESWFAFNIPGKVVSEFEKNFVLNSKEAEIYDALHRSNINKEKSYYLIGNIETDVESFNHELCHAFYFLHPEFRLECDELTKKLPEKIVHGIRTGLENMNYNIDDNNIVSDEFAAYLATSSSKTFNDCFNMKYKDVKEYSKSYEKLFRKYLKKIKKTELS